MPVDIIPLLLPLLAGLCLIIGIAVLRFSRARGIAVLLAGVCVFLLFLGIYFVPVWWMAAAAKTPEEQYRVGKAYMDRGSYNFPDLSESAKWYEKAAEGGYAPAQVEIGLRYLSGAGVPKDRNKARRWFEKAAEQGDERAKEYLDQPVYWQQP